MHKQIRPWLRWQCRVKNVCSVCSLIVPSCSVKREVTQFCNVSLHNMVSDKVENSRPVFSNRTLSLRPKRNSGIPERKTRILIEPTISLRRTLPLALTWNTGGFKAEKTHCRPQQTQQVELTNAVTHTGRKFIKGLTGIPSAPQPFQNK